MSSEPIPELETARPPAPRVVLGAEWRLDFQAGGYGVPVWGWQLRVLTKAQSVLGQDHPLGEVLRGWRQPHVGGALSNPH